MSLAAPTWLSNPGLLVCHALHPPCTILALQTPHTGWAGKPGSPCASPALKSPSPQVGKAGLLSTTHIPGRSLRSAGCPAINLHPISAGFQQQPRELAIGLPATQTGDKPTEENRKPSETIFTIRVLKKKNGVY